MTRLRRGPGAAVLAAFAAACLLSAAPATAADEVTIDHVETSDGVVSMIVSVDGIPGGEAGGSDVSVQIDGKAVDAKAEAVSAGKVARSTILVVDASNSMRGAKFDAATEAVTAFLATAPPDVQIGMVAFAGTVGTTVAPTTDRTALLDDFKSLDLAAGTGVYDAVAEAVKLAGSDGSRSLLLLSDGADTGSDATLTDVAKAAAKAEVVIDVVSIGAAAKADALSTLADETHGQVIPADADALGEVFADQAKALAQQLLVTVELPPEISGDADITVNVEGVGASFQDSAFVNVGERAATASEGPKSVVVASPLVSTPVMFAGAAALFIGLFALLWTLLTARSSRNSSADKRLDVYFGGGEVKGKRAGESPALKDSAIAMTEKMVSADFETKIAKRLAGAGSALTVAEWVLLHAAIGMVTAAVFFFMLGFAMAFLGLLLGLVLPWLYLKRRHGKRLAAFNGQLAETLGLMAGGLQAGLSLPQAVDTVVREGIEPMAGELRRALVEQRLGVDITDGLEAVGERMESDDFGWVVMAIRIQREVGGNLAEILHTVADTLREREYLRRQVKALSAEGRLSGYILTALPPFVMIYLSFANRPYIEVLWTTPLGWVILAVAGFMLLMGGLAMSKMAKVEV